MKAGNVGRRGADSAGQRGDKKIKVPRPQERRERNRSRLRNRGNSPVPLPATAPFPCAEKFPLGPKALTTAKVYTAVRNTNS